MQAALKSSVRRGVADPESASGAYLTRDPDLGFRISFLITDPRSRFLEQFFGLKILTSFSIPVHNLNKINL
jgi:hypothetical protein